MANADDNSRDGTGRGASSSGGRHLFRIPLNRTVRLSIPPGVRVIRGPGGRLQMIQTRASAPNSNSSNTDSSQQPGAAPNPILQQLQAQQRERMEREEQSRLQNEQAKKEKEEKLKSKLAYSDAPQVVDFNEDELTAQLLWEKKELVVPEDTKEIEYTVLASTDDKSDAKKIYNGPENSCAVGKDLLLHGHSYHFTIAASFGEASGDPSPKATLVVPPRAPCQPLPPKVANRAKNALTLRWNAPQDNGSSITHYELEWDQCKQDWQQLVSDKAKQYKFTQKLPAGAVAQFRVKASNEVGDSPFSEPLVFTVGAGVPSVPQPPTLCEAAVHQLSLEWTPPECNGAAVESYMVEMEDPDSGYGYRPVYQGELTHVTCTGLKRVQGYNFRLTAINAKGPSPTSPSVMFCTLPSIPDPPSAPFLDFRVKPSHNFLSIVWKCPRDDGGAAIYNYMVQIDNGSGVNREEVEMKDVYSGPDRSALVEGLRPGKKYKARVCACNTAGRSDWSPTSILCTPAIPPSAPLYIYVAGRPTVHTICLQWGYPLSDGGARVLSYDLEMNNDNSRHWAVVATLPDPRPPLEEGAKPPSPQPLLSYTVTDLEPGTQYQFRVVSRNDVGPSPPSVECLGVTAAGPPSSPGGITAVDISATTAQIIWQMPRCHGSPVEGYLIQWYGDKYSDNVSTTNTSANHIYLRNLFPINNYHVRIKSVSPAGNSDWSDPLVFTTGPAPPSPPSLTQVVAATPYSITVEWNEPNPNGSPITCNYIELRRDAKKKCELIRVTEMETQFVLMDLKPNSIYQIRVQCENAIGRGKYGECVAAKTLPPPPTPPHLSLASCTSQAIKMNWGKKTSKSISYLLHMTSEGNQFHEVYSGNAVNHRVTRLQPSTKYIFRVAGISSSGQGEWSDHVVVMTTPPPPMVPRDLVMTQVSDTMLQLMWPASDSPYPMSYEAQYRVVQTTGDYQQCYKGPGFSVSINLNKPPAGIGPVLFEGRVRSCATCQVNNREEHVWSSYSAPVMCKWVRQTPLEIPGLMKAEKEEEKAVEGVKDYTKAYGILAFVLIAVFSVVLALILGQLFV